MSTKNRFSESETEAFYDAQDALYRRFWDREGSLHWGIFDDKTGEDFLKASANLNQIMLDAGRITGQSSVVDLGCGNGNTARWLTRSVSCRVVGVDLSGVRVQSALHGLAEEPDEVRGKVNFVKGSITDLPFDDGSFSHAWSQAAIYHVPDKQAVLREAHRVVEDGGVFVFDDLIKPKPDISERARKFVYDRLLFDTDFSFEGYQEALEGVGFNVTVADDLSEQLAKSYSRLSEMARGIEEDHYQQLADAYDQMVKCIEDRDIGWAMYVCEKRS